MDYKIKDYQTRMPREPNTQYVLSLSYGKDSLACLEAIRILGLPLDRIVHAEVWATDTIPADLPPMVEFKKKADKIILERYGIVVEHICAVERERERPLSFERQFYSIRNNKRIGGECIYGFPMVRGPWCNSKLKLAALERIEKIDFRETLLSRPQAASNGERERESTIEGFPNKWHLHCNRLKSRTILDSIRFPETDDAILSVSTQRKHPRPIYTDSPCQSIGETGVLDSNRGFSSCPSEQGAKINTVQYLGIAADEPERIARHTKPGVVLPLVLAGWDEAFCRQLCKELDLLSPIYTDSARGGCWFCHNQGIDQLRLLRRNYPDLWALLLKWDNDSPVTFHPDGHTVHHFDIRFQAEDEGRVPTDRKFRWKMLNL